MAFTVQAAFGEVTVTISSSGEYDGMTAEDMANICRRTPCAPMQTSPWI